MQSWLVQHTIRCSKPFRSNRYFYFSCENGQHLTNNLIVGSIIDLSTWNVFQSQLVRAHSKNCISTYSSKKYHFMTVLHQFITSFQRILLFFISVNKSFSIKVCIKRPLNWYLFLLVYSLLFWSDGRDVRMLRFSKNVLFTRLTSIFCSSHQIKTEFFNKNIGNHKDSG